VTLTPNGPEIAITVLVLALAAVVGSVIVRLLERKPNRAEVERLAGGIVHDEAARSFYWRYLIRQRRFQNLGGVVGFAVGAAMAVHYEAGLTLYFGGAPIPLADVLFMTVAGVVCGGLAGESYRLGPGPRLDAAILEERARYAPTGVLRAARLILAASALAAVANGLAGLGWGYCLCVAFAAVPAGWAELTQRAIRDRRRPALPLDVMAADTAVRRWAGRSTAWLELALALLAVEWALPLAHLAQPWADLVALVGLVSLVLALWALLRSTLRASAIVRRWLGKTGEGAAQPPPPAAGATRPEPLAVPANSRPAGTPLDARPAWAPPDVPPETLNPTPASRDDAA
jgi:hypothetical protein